MPPTTPSSDRAAEWAAPPLRRRGASCELVDRELDDADTTTYTIAVCPLRGGMRSSIASCSTKGTARRSIKRIVSGTVIRCPHSLVVLRL